MKTKMKHKKAVRLTVEVGEKRKRLGKNKLKKLLHEIIVDNEDVLKRLADK